MPRLRPRLDALERHLEGVAAARLLDVDSGIYRILDGMGAIPVGPYDGDALLDQLFEALGNGPDDYLDASAARPS